MMSIAMQKKIALWVLLLLTLAGISLAGPAARAQSVRTQSSQCQFELENLKRAADELARAYLREGSEIFDAEDPKYFDFLKTRITMPQEGS